MVSEKQLPDNQPGSLPTLRADSSVIVQGPGTRKEDLSVKARIIPAQPVELPRAWVTILSELCKGCEMCVHGCPSGNLEMSEGLNRNGYHPVLFNYQGRSGPCSACGICHIICPDFAISKVWRFKKQ